MIIKTLKLLLGGLAALLVLAALVLLLFYLRASFSKQTEDPQHLDGKRAYLADLSRQGAAPPGAPNIVLILFDDMGYGDLGFNGNAAIKTPAIDQLARDGVRLSNYYAAAPSCSPSRAAMLTGRLPPRAGVPEVLFPTGSTMELVLKARGINVRLPADEITLAEVLKARGYRTGMVGKWHLGDRHPSLPSDFGFDAFFGAHYSNDIEPFALYRNQTIEQPAPADQTRLNDTYTREATAFIQKPGKAPFFLYFAHNFPHQPLFTAKANQGRSAGGLYGDIVEALDDSVAAVVAVLKAQGALDNTLIIISSDNGPWFQGSPGRMRGRKGLVFEGGVHMPLVVHWPAAVPGGRVIEGMAMGTDWLPTVMDWLGVAPPKDRVLDGSSLRQMLTQGGASPHDFLYFYGGTKLMAVRDARFKYHAAAPLVYAPQPLPFGVGMPQPEWLFDLLIDPEESYDTAALHRDRAQRLAAALKAKDADMATNLRGWVAR